MVEGIKVELVEQKTDHLFLLVGANPLPNFVAAKVLAGKYVHLLYSDDQQSGVPSTFRYAKMLQRELSDLGLQVTTYGVHDASPRRICGQVSNIIQDLQRPEQEEPLDLAKHSIGLNYTGATKPMAVHVHRALSDLKTAKPVCFSYLDPRRLSFWFDDSNTPLPIAQNGVMLDLQTLARLHGFTLPKTDEKGGPRSQPQHLSLAKAILEVHGTPAGFDAWRAWVNTGAHELPSAT